MTAPSGYVAVNSLGLGHAARAVAIAEELVRRHPDLYLFFLAGSPALDLAIASGFDAMPLPPTRPGPRPRSRDRPPERAVHRARCATVLPGSRDPAGRTRLPEADGPRRPGGHGHRRIPDRRGREGVAGAEPPGRADDRRERTEAEAGPGPRGVLQGGRAEPPGLGPRGGPRDRDGGEGDEDGGDGGG